MKKADEAEVMRLLSDPWWRFRNLYHIKSEESGEIIPFVPYPEQEQVFHAVIDEGHQRIIIPKARRRGMSTGIGVFMEDHALNRPGFEGGIVDRNAGEATKKLVNTIKTGVDKLPPFLLDSITKVKDNDDQLSFRVGKDTPSAIYAGTGYRGGNCNILHISEWGWIQAEDPKRSEEIQTGAVQAARKGIIIVETTWKGGKHGHLWDYTEMALETPEEEKHARSWRVMFFPWHTDPVYRVPGVSKIRPEVLDYFYELADKYGIICDEEQMRWYQEEAWPLKLNRFGEYPSVLDECFLSPMEGVIYESEMARALAERRITTIPVEEYLPVFVSIDIGRNDAFPMTFIQVVGKEVRVVGYHVSHRELVRYYANKIHEWRAKRKHQGPIVILLPHDGGKVSLETGNTLVEAFREAGFEDVRRIPKIGTTWTGINYVRDTFPYMWFDKSAIETRCERGTKKFPTLKECLDNYHQAEQKNGMMVSMEPVHDDYSHGCDSLRTFCEGWQRGLISRTVGRINGMANEDFTEGSTKSSTKMAGGNKWR